MRSYLNRLLCFSLVLLTSLSFGMAVMMGAKWVTAAVTVTSFDSTVTPVDQGVLFVAALAVALLASYLSRPVKLPAQRLAVSRVTAERTVLVAA